MVIEVVGSWVTVVATTTTTSEGAFDETKAFAASSVGLLVVPVLLSDPSTSPLCIVLVLFWLVSVDASATTPDIPPCVPVGEVVSVVLESDVGAGLPDKLVVVVLWVVVVIVVVVAAGGGLWGSGAKD